MIEKPLLQVALDLTDIKEAVLIAKQARDGGADIIEVGTPLIKSAGTNAIKSIKGLCKNLQILADLKTLDAGWLEAELAAKNGADIVSVSALAHNKTIVDAVMCARNYEIKIMADLMQVQNPIDRAIELCDLGIDYLCLHSGIDAQKSERASLSRGLKLISSVVKNCNIPVAVAGGLNNTTACEVVKAGAKVVVIGSYITKSANAYESTKRVRDSIDKV